MESLKRYAADRGLEYSEGLRVPMSLSIRSNVAANAAVSGDLGEGIEGTIANCSHSTEEGTVEGTVCVIDVPESTAFLPLLYCRDSDYRHTKTLRLGAEGFASEYTTIEFESETVNRSYAVQVSPAQDQLWLRQLFSPTLLDWLAERAPLEFTFEVVEGTMCARMAEMLTSPDQLDLLAQLSSHVAARIRKQALEEERPAAFADPLPPPADTDGTRHAAEMAAKVDWPEPPADLDAAVKAYRPPARAEPGGWGPAIKVGGGIGLLVAIVAAPIGFVSGDALLGAATGAGGSLIGVGFGFVLGGWLFRMTRRSQVHRRALAYGQLAFATEYARSRGLALEDPASFQKRFMRIKLPGPARWVMRGTLPGIGRFGRVILCGDPSGANSGFELAIVEGPGAESLVAIRASPFPNGVSVEGLDAVCRDAGKVVARPVGAPRGLGP